MAITSITISQSNKSGNADLLSVNNPLIFLVDVVYVGTPPDILYVALRAENYDLLETFAAIPYSDSVLNSTRTFAFIAQDILKAYMGEIDDFEGQEKILEYVEGMTKVFTLNFYIDVISDQMTFTAIQAARQFGDSPCLTDIYNNVDETYYGAVGKPIYVYFYNNNIDNVLTIDTPTEDINAALDYDDVVFIDSDDQYFKIP